MNYNEFKEMYEYAKFGVGIGVFGFVIIAFLIIATLMGWA